MKQIQGKLLWNREVKEGSFVMGVEGDSVYEAATPGQFVMMGVRDLLSPLLKRPFSIHRVIRNRGAISAIEILYKVVGESTRLFSKLKSGDEISLLGPLGRGFSWTPPVGRIVLVGGGIGVAPLVFLAESLKASGVDLSCSLGLIGGRRKEDILCDREMAALSLPVRISTDNGTLGKKGFVTELLLEALSEGQPEMIYACGPRAMLKAVSEIAYTHSISCQLSIETMMACGMGACLACAVPGRKEEGKYRHACLDGPVFDAIDVAL